MREINPKKEIDGLYDFSVLVRAIKPSSFFHGKNEAQEPENLYLRLLAIENWLDLFVKEKGKLIFPDDKPPDEKQTCSNIWLYCLCEKCKEKRKVHPLKSATEA